MDLRTSGWNNKAGADGDCQNLDYLATDAEFRVVINATRIVLRSAVIGAMAAWAAYILTGFFMKAAIVGIAFFIVSGFASLRRWLEGPVVLVFILATIHWCDATIIPRLANYAGFARWSPIS